MARPRSLGWFPGRSIIGLALAALALLLAVERDVAADACCARDMCFDVAPDLCIMAGGMPFPGMTCTPDPCRGGAMVGACCGVISTCTLSDEATCATFGGTYLGDGSLCAPDPCLSGACCDGPSCTEGDAASCGGSFLGAGTRCLPDPCALGACCGAAGCSELSEAACLGGGGSFEGVASDCSPDPCVSCDVLLIAPIELLLAVKAGLADRDVELSWRGDVNANSYNAWSVADKALIPSADSDLPATEVCRDAVATSCLHAGGVASGPAALYYNLLGVCHGVEAAD